MISCDRGEYRNLARFRAVYQSSCADFDQTSQLVTDGIISDRIPDMAVTYLNGTPLPAYKTEWPLDLAKWSGIPVEDKALDYVYYTGSVCVKADGVHVSVHADRGNSMGRLLFGFEVYTSSNAVDWTLAGRVSGVDDRKEGSNPLRVLEADVDFGREISYNYIRLVADCGGATVVKLFSLIQMLDGKPVYTLDKAIFNSCWVSATGENEWIYVDLGAKSEIRELVFNWLRRPVSGRLLFSDDAESWKTAVELTESDTLAVRGRARYVKVEMDRTADGKPFALSELQITGRNTLKRTESGWMLCREENVDDPQAWLPANVPGTVLSSYIDAGAVPEITVSDNNHCVSHSYFRSNFIYRGRMTAPEDISDKVWLNFDGINWKADVSLNGVALGHIAGAFQSARFDVTDVVRPGGNDVEVKIYCNDHPGVGRMNTREREAYNGGVLGADNPTFHASIGWDWMPSLAGRNIGIWNDVYFTSTGVVTVEDPYVVTKLNLPDTTRALINASAVLRNHGLSQVTAQVGFAFGPSECSDSVVIPAGGEVVYDKEVILDNPALWWPNGYGAPNLYDVSFCASVDGVVSDSESFKAGVRQMTYDTSDGSLKLFVNGRRFVGRGGNWGFSEVNLRYREKDYDRAVAYHAQQNFTMIRNWVCQIGDEELYDACDKYGIMIWQDFWLANPNDGPNPFDEDMFMDNARDYVRRIRNHPSIALYCGRNEGYPPASLNSALENLVSDCTDLFYIPSSADGLVSGRGKYWRMSAEDYFGAWGNDRFHSERGMPNIVNYESLLNFIPADKAWPVGQMWAEHDWSRGGAMRSDEYDSALKTMFGKIDSAEQFCKLSQWLNYDGYRAIFEGRSINRRGMLLWMSHPAWPSLLWCTYDYYLDPTAAFFGAKKACEPLHIQWNPLTCKVEVVNISAGSRKALKATSKLLRMDGSLLVSESSMLDSEEDSTVELMDLSAPEGEAVYYISLSLEDGNTDELLSSNFYVLGAETDNFQALNSLPKTSIQVSTSLSSDEDSYVMTVRLANRSQTPAMMLHLIPRAAGNRVLPYDADDNYFHLMPHEERIVNIRMQKECCYGAKPSVSVEGFNIL